MAIFLAEEQAFDYGKKQPAVRIYREEKEFIGEALHAGLDGSQTAALEKEAAQYVGRAYGAALSSGTAALHLALKLAGERLFGSTSGISTPAVSGRGGALQGKRVFCPDFAALESAAPVVYEGGEPVFIDCGETDWSMDPEVLELAFRKYPEVGIVIMNHAWGFPGQIMKIKEICHRYGALLIEDCSESLGAAVWTGEGSPREEQAAFYGAGQDGDRKPQPEGRDSEGRREADASEGLWRQTGSFGDYAILDFGPERIITGGSGGMLFTDDRYSAEKALYWAGGARALAPWDQYEELGYSYRMSDLTAAAVRGQFKHLPERMEKKKAIYERYADGLEGDLAALIPLPEGTRPNYWMSCMTVQSSIGFLETRNERDYTYVKQHGTAAPMEIYEALNKFYGDAGCGAGRGTRREGSPWRDNALRKCRPLYKPLSLQPIFQNYEAVTLDGSRWSCRHFYEDDYWVRCHRAREYFESGLCLPSDAGMTEEEQERVIEIICACYDGVEFERGSRRCL